MAIDLEERLRSYGEVLDQSLQSSAPTVAVGVDRSRSLGWFRPVSIGIGALAAIGIAFILLRDDSGEGVVAIIPGDTASSESDLAAGQVCIDSLFIQLDDDKDLPIGAEPVEEAVLQAEPVVLSSPAKPDSVTVFLRGDTQLVVCRDGSDERFDSVGIGPVGNDAGTTGIEVWDFGGPSGATHGPSDVLFDGVVSDDVRSVALVIGDERIAGVVKQGWFLVEATLTGPMSEVGDIAIDWTNADGTSDSKTVLVWNAGSPGNDESAGFVPPG